MIYDLGYAYMRLGSEVISRNVCVHYALALNFRKKDAAFSSLLISKTKLVCVHEPLCLYACVFACVCVKERAMFVI